jgi:hypothetical protein
VVPEEKFDPQKHRAHGVENPPAEAVVAETLAPGLTFQGRLIRPALVRLRDASVPAVETANEVPETAPEKSEAAAPDQLSLEAD